MTGNSGEIWTIFLAPLLLLPIPLLPIHILWVNLVTDGLCRAWRWRPNRPSAASCSAARAPRESLFAHGMWQHILGVGLLIGGLCLAVQAWALHTGHAHWQTMVFTVLTLAQMAHVIAIRSESEPIWRLGLWSNRPLLGAVLLTFALQLATIYVPWLNPIFRTEPLSLGELALCIGAALVVLVVVEIEKAWRRSQPQRRRRQSPRQRRWTSRDLRVLWAQERHKHIANDSMTPWASGARMARAIGTFGSAPARVEPGCPTPFPSTKETSCMKIEPWPSTLATAPTPPPSLPPPCPCTRRWPTRLTAPSMGPTCST